MDTVKTALVGCGKIGRTHALALRDAGCEVVGL